jgi:hypothetical protein
MKASDFRKWLEKISQLSRGQKEQVRHCLSEVAPSGVATFSLLRVQAYIHSRIGNPFGPSAA